MHVAVEVLQREVGRDAHVLPFGGAVRGRGAEDRDVDLLVDDERCAQRVGDDSEIDLPVDDERVAVTRGHAHVAAAQAFGLELPPDRGAQVVERDEERVPGSCRGDGVLALVRDDDEVGD